MTREQLKALYRAAARKALTATTLEWREFAWDECLRLEAELGAACARGLEQGVRAKLRAEQ